MAFEQNPDCGSLFRNDKKSKPTDRDHNGDAKVTCAHCGKTTDHWLSAWVNDMKSGAKYFGIRFSPKDNQGSGDVAPKPTPEDFDDDIPF